MTNDEIDNAVGYWHEQYHGSLQLWEWLGWSFEEYKIWLEKSIIPEKYRL